MAESEIRRGFEAVIEEHPASMTRDGEEAMERLLEQAAARVAEEPDRADEAQQNLQRLLDHAAEVKAREEGGTDVFTIDRVAIDADAVRLALRDLCPFFPFC